MKNKRFSLLIFLVFFSMLGLIRLVMLLGKYVPLEHDTFQYLHLQYLIFNELAFNKGIPQWCPFMTHGTLANFWVTISQGILMSAFLPFFKFIHNFNFLVFFQLGLLLDEAALLLGTLLLAKRFFRSAATIIFVIASIVFTAVSSIQIWWELHLFYLMPICIYCLIRALEDNSVPHLFLFSFFGPAMLLGNVAYTLLAVWFAIFVFLLSLFLSDPKRAFFILHRFRRSINWKEAIAILIFVFFNTLIWLYLKDGFKDIVTNTGRSQLGLNSLKLFLNYGYNTELRKFLDLINMYPTNKDFSLYGGLLVVPFVITTLALVRSRVANAFWLTAVTLAMFSCATVVSIGFFYLFPLGKTYRHIGYIGQLVKFFFVFYAGFGFELFWLSLKNKSRILKTQLQLKDNLFFLIPLLSLEFILFLFIFERLNLHSIFALSDSIKKLFVGSGQIYLASICPLVLCGLFIIFLLAIVYVPKKAFIFGVLLLMLHCGDTFLVKGQREILRIPKVNTETLNLFRKYKYNFSIQRKRNYFENERFIKFYPNVNLENKTKVRVIQDFLSVITGKYGSLYWSTDAFLFFDAAASLFRTDNWLRDVDALNMVWVPVGLRDMCHIDRPMPESLVFRKISGISYPKLQFFSKIHILPNEQDLTRILADSNFSADIVLGVTEDKDVIRPAEKNYLNSLNLNKNERVNNVKFLIKDFSFNKLDLQVDNKQKDPLVLYYADAWDSKWKAYVNGRPAQIYKANLAYKAVVVPKGFSGVVFVLDSQIARIGHAAFFLLGIFTCFGLLYLFFRDLVLEKKLKKI